MGLYRVKMRNMEGGTRKRCGICGQIGHRRNGCPQAPKEPPTNPQTQPPIGSSQQTQSPTHGHGTEPPIHTPAEAPIEDPGTQPPIHITTEAATDTPIQPPTEAPPGSHASSEPQQPIQQPSTTTNPTTQIEPGATQQSQAPPA